MTYHWLGPKILPWDRRIWLTSSSAGLLPANQAVRPLATLFYERSPKKSRMDRLFERMESHGFESLTLSERSAFALRWLYVEVNNGGFDQFFFNDAGKLAGDALRGLEFLGAQGTASILRRAMSVFPDGVIPADQTARREFLCDSLTDEQKEIFEQCDSEFYSSSEPVSDLLTAYIEKHPEEFPT